MSTLSDAFAKEFERVLEAHDLTATAAARLLGVSRQTFSSYLHGKSIPREAVQARAADLWSIGFAVGEVKFDSSAFQGAIKPGPRRQEVQLELFARLDAIQEKDLRVSVKREGSTLNVAVEIDIPA